MEENTIFCVKCGAKLSADSKFCTECGAVVPTNLLKERAVKAEEKGTAFSEEADSAGIFAEEPEEETEEKREVRFDWKSRKVRFLLLGILAAVVVVILIIVAVTRPTKVNLDQYITVEYSGYDGYGTATAHFDEDAFYGDYANKIKIKSTGYDTLDGLLSQVLPAEELYYDCVSFSVDAGEFMNGELSNGDTVTVVWDCNDSMAQQYFGVKLKYSESEETVSELEELTEVDVFEGITLEYEGASPMAEAYLMNNSSANGISDLSDWDFTLSKESGFSNGDTITVRISDDAVTYLEKNYGKTPANKEKKYVVEGLDEYITQISDMPEELVKDIQSASEETIRENAVNFWSNATLTGLEYVGMYLFYREQYETQDFSSFSTDLYAVYAVSTHESDSYMDAYEDYEADFNYYTYVEFYDPFLMSDGIGAIDLEENSLCSERLEHTHTNRYNWGYEWDVQIYYHGYETLQELEDALIYAEYDHNAYDTTVDVSAQGGASVADAETAAEETSDASDAEYLCAFSSERLITNADMASLENANSESFPGDRELAQMMVNEIYARHGCRFEDEELNEYFGKKDWYQAIGTYETDKDKIYDSMSQIEKGNIDFLKAY